MGDRLVSGISIEDTLAKLGRCFNFSFKTPDKLMSYLEGQMGWITIEEPNDLNDFDIYRTLFNSEKPRGLFVAITSKACWENLSWKDNLGGIAFQGEELNDFVLSYEGTYGERLFKKNVFFINLEQCTVWAYHEDGAVIKFSYQQNLAAETIWTKGAVILLWGAFVLWMYSLFLPPFAPEEFLFSLAWKYSLLIILPISYLLLKKRNFYKNNPGWNRICMPFFIPVMLYCIVGSCVARIPGTFVYHFNYPTYSSVVTINSIQLTRSKSCQNRATVTFEEYQRLLENIFFNVCVDKPLAESLSEGEKMILDGKRGIGGFLILDYRKAGHPNLSLDPDADKSPRRST